MRAAQEHLSFPSRSWLMSLAQESRPEVPRLEFPGFIDQLLLECTSMPDPPSTPALIGRRSELSAAVIHLQAITTILSASEPPEPWEVARLSYHACWILRLANHGDGDLRPLVSVIIPVFNRANLVTEAIESALKQTHDHVEIIVIDDGSTDHLMAVLHPYLTKIHLIRQPHNGVASARNQGLRAARGDFLSFLDSDDLLDPEWITEAIQSFQSIADAELCYAPAWQEKPPGPDQRAFFKYQILHGNEGCPSNGLLQAVVDNHHTFLIHGVLLPRWLALAVKGFDEQLIRGEDTRFWFKLALRDSKVVGLRKRINHRRRQEDGLSATSPPCSTLCIRLMNLIDLMDNEKHWIHAQTIINQLHDSRAWLSFERCHDRLATQVKHQLLQQLAKLRLGNRADREPMLVAFKQVITTIVEHSSSQVSDLKFAQAISTILKQTTSKSPTNHSFKPLRLDSGNL